MKRLILALAAAIGLTQGGLASAQAQQALSARATTKKSSKGQALEGVAVLVNDQVISYTDVRNRVQLILLSIGGKPDEQTIAQAQRTAIDALIDEKLQVREFHKQFEKAQIDEREIDEAIANIARQNNMTGDAFAKDLTARGVPIQTLRDQMRAEIAWRQLVRARYASRIRVSQLQIDDMFERVKGGLDKSQYRLAEVFIPAPDQSSKANAIKSANSLRGEIEKGASFQAVARQFSAAASASVGGELGWLPEPDVRPEILAAIKSLKPPAVTPPIATDEGVYLIAYIGRREPADIKASVMDLKQLAAKGDGAAARLTRISQRITTCADVEKAAKAADGIVVQDLNDVALSDLSPAFKTALENQAIGKPTGVLDIPEGKAVVVVCNRQIGGGAMPTREQMSDRLFKSQIAMLSDRYLRDIKREASIVRR